MGFRTQYIGPIYNIFWKKFWSNQLIADYFFNFLKILFFYRRKPATGNKFFSAEQNKKVNEGKFILSWNCLRFFLSLLSSSPLDFILPKILILDMVQKFYFLFNGYIKICIFKIFKNSKIRLKNGDLYYG